MGIGFNTGVKYEKKGQSLKIASFEWSSEAEDFLAERDLAGNIDYQGGLGNVGFFDNVVKGNSNQEIVTRHGWELSLFDVFSLQQGHYEDSGGSVSYDTDGFGLNLTGILRAASVLNPAIGDNTIAGFFIRHTDIEYLRSGFDAGSGNYPLEGTDFDAIRISLF